MIATLAAIGVAIGQTPFFAVSPNPQCGPECVDFNRRVVVTEAEIAWWVGTTIVKPAVSASALKVIVAARPIEIVLARIWCCSAKAVPQIRAQCIIVIVAVGPADRRAHIARVGSWTIPVAGAANLPRIATYPVGAVVAFTVGLP